MNCLTCKSENLMIVNYVASFGFYTEILEHCYHFSRQKLYSLATGQGGSFFKFQDKIR